MTAARAVAALLIAAAIGCRSPSAARPSRADAATASALPPSLAFAPAIIELDAPHGERRSHDARLAGRLASQARLTIEHVDDSALEVQVLPPDGSGASGLRLTFLGDHAGVRTGQVVVTTNLDEPPRATLLYSLRVPSHVTVRPSNPVFDLGESRSRERRLEVIGLGPDFRVITARVLTGPFRASIESDGTDTDGVATIRVRVDEAAIGSSTERGFLGKLRIRGNDPAQPDADVPLFAMGALPPHPRASDAARQGIPGHGNEPIRGGDATVKPR